MLSLARCARQVVGGATRLYIKKQSVTLLKAVETALNRQSDTVRDI